jgi:hypothetical protein
VWRVPMAREGSECFMNGCAASPRGFQLSKIALSDLRTVWQVELPWLCPSPGLQNSDSPNDLST